MRDRFISTQVCMLLDRMDTHPEEFAQMGHLSQFSSVTRWGYILEQGEFSRLEDFLLKRKLRRLRRKATQTFILDAFLNDAQEREFESGPRMSTAGRFSDRLQQKMVLNKAQIEMLRNASKIFPTKL